MSTRDGNVAVQLRRLEKMSAPELRVLWRETFGHPHPSGVQKDFLLRALAYRVQERAYGGLPRDIRRRLLAYAEELKTSGRIKALDRCKIKPGTRLVRAWGGDTHVVTVLDKNFEYHGKRYGSLSEIARAITRVRWSGPRFFGLKDREPSPNGQTRVT